jgi:signal transduction histidine kinase
VAEAGASMSGAASLAQRGRVVLSLALAPALRRRGTALLTRAGRVVPPGGHLTKALLVAVAYYLGAELAFWVGTLSYFFAPLWPPNMILFCALLLAPYRSWWLYIAAALPAHVAAETGMGMDALPLLGAFACNSALALSSAAALRWLSDGPPWLDTMRKAWTFILVVAIGAPALVAAVIAALGWLSGNGIGSVEFAERWGVGNALGGIALAPIFVTWIGEGVGWLGRASLRRRLEAGLLAAALVLSAYFGFPAASASYPVLALTPIPLMLWAAVRFGSRGASGAILLVSAMALAGAIEGRAPFAAASPEHTILSLQTFLAVLSAPFLVLAAVAVEGRRANTEVSELSARLLSAQDEERRRIARELHDGTGQTLAAAGMNLRRLLRGSALEASQRETAEESVALLDETHSEIRTLSYLLHPPMLDEAGLGPALKWYVDGFKRRSEIVVGLLISPDIGRSNPDIELAFYRVVQECLTNVHRHSGSKTAEIRLERRPGKLMLAVSDAGRGMMSEGTVGEADSLRALGVGIAGMRARLKQLGGVLEIRSSPAGTTVMALVPLSRRASL